MAILKNTEQFGCVCQDMEPPKSSSILWKISNIRKPIQCVKFTKADVHHADIRDQNPSLGMICPGDPHQRNPNAPKFEDRSQEETEWQERCAREAAWRQAKNILKIQRKNIKQHSSHLRRIGVYLHHQQLNQRKVQQTTTGCTLYPELRDNERTYSWCSTWQDRSTTRVPPRLECVEEMLQESRLSRWRFYRFHDRFLRDPVNRESQLAIGWTEKECKEWDELAKEDHTHHLTPEEKKRYQGRRQKWAYETSIWF